MSSLVFRILGLTTLFSSYTCIILFLIFIYTYLRNRTDKANKYFSFLFLSAAIYAFGEYQLNNVSSINLIFFWHRFEHIGAILLISTFPMAIHSYLNISRKNLIIRILLGFTALYLLILFPTEFLISNKTHYYSEYSLHGEEGVLYGFYSFTLFFSMVYSYTLLIYRNMELKLKSALLMMVGFGIALLSGFFDLLRIFANISFKFGAIFPYGIIIMAFVSGYILLKRFMDVYKQLDNDEQQIRKMLFKSRKEFMNLLELISSTMDAKDRYTAGHSRRVEEYALLIANSLHLDDDDKRKLKSACLLHDIGKIGVSELILNKPGKLTDAEFAEIKKHPIIGVEILSNVNDFVKILAYVLYHHERPDGTGYPLGLKDEQIPLLAKIIAIADTYDALTTDRPYRKAMQKEDAIKEMLSVKGTQLDSSIVSKFILLI